MLSLDLPRGNEEKIKKNKVQNQEQSGSNRRNIKKAAKFYVFL